MGRTPIGMMGLRIVVVAAGAAALSACATAPVPPPPPPPPPPVVEVIPPRPTAPGGASDDLFVPPLDANGTHQTVNSGISELQIVWNMRAGLNVAALNCRSVRHAGLIENYGAFLKKHARQLADINTRLSDEYQTRYGRTYRDTQDSYMTKVYNYFALPPALDDFCDAALSVSRELQAVEQGNLAGFAGIALPRMEGVFQNFYRTFVRYKREAAAWDAKYGSPAQSRSEG